MGNNLNLKKLVLTGILSALVYAITVFTMVKVPFVIVKEAYFHAGDGIIYLCGMVLGGANAAIAGGIGSFLADLFLGAPQYMFATLIIKGIMGGIAGYFLYSSKGEPSIKKKIIGLSVAGLWMALGYYFYEVFVLSINWYANLPNLLTNIAQAIVGIFVFIPLSKSAARLKKLE